MIGVLWCDSAVCVCVQLCWCYDVCPLVYCSLGVGVVVVDRTTPGATTWPGTIKNQAGSLGFHRCSLSSAVRRESGTRRCPVGCIVLYPCFCCCLYNVTFHCVNTVAFVSSFSVSSGTAVAGGSYSLQHYGFTMVSLRLSSLSTMWIG